MEKSTKKWKSFGWEGSLGLVGALAVGAFGLVGSCDSDKTGQHPGGITGVTGAGGSYAGGDELIAATAQSLMNGRNTFRFDTFGDEAFWGDALKLHQAIAGAANGGVGDGRQPEDGAGGRLEGRRRGGARRRRRRHQGGHRRSRRSGDDAGAAEAERGRGPHRLLRHAPASCARSASSARSVTRPSTIRSCPASASGSTAGRTAISTSARSSRWRPICRRSNSSCGVDRATVLKVVRSLGAGKVRRRAGAGRQGLPSRRQDGGDAAAGGVRPRGRQRCTPTPGGARSRTGTRSSRTSR